VYTTIGVAQQDIDVFGIASNLQLGKQQVALSQMKYELSSLELEQSVKTAWAKAYIARRQLEAYKRLDSVYKEFERAVSLRYQVEAISKLQWLSAKNLASQMHLKHQQSQANYKMALQGLNLLVGSEEFYQVSP